MTTKEKLELKHKEGLIETALFNANQAQSKSNENSVAIVEQNIIIEEEQENTEITMETLDSIMSVELPSINDTTEDLQTAIDEILTNVIPQILMGISE